MTLALMACVAPVGAQATDLRIATYNAEMDRKGPGLLLRDILSGKDEQIAAVLTVIATAKPDILTLQGFDHDFEGHALHAFQIALADQGHDMPHAFAAMPNSGLATGFDMDGNGRTHEPRDAQGYGHFTGQGGMAVLSRYPLGEVQDFSAFLWKDLPGAIPPTRNASPFPSSEAFAIQRLSSVAHWDVPVQLSNGTTLHLLTFHATTPVFDGDEDRNGRRNRDEIAFWQRYLDGALPFPAPDQPLIIAGVANLDPNDGDGRRDAISRLLSDPRLQDPEPRRSGLIAEGDAGQSGDPALDTVDWPDPSPGDLRVSYILPAHNLDVVDAGVFWPADNDPMLITVNTASRHRLVWVDLRF
ncbi:endonuclease/exonuclease/phosphatase family protein [Aliiroseovarius sp. Z3]|uniref:endonuclease/exonuclease/phosphatase family protein n=1 Tax=Aliiroseovarius sp. Z3 TaxID=2811402 RepID=UPI0023B2EF2D|nr:endonuclease/exonuclease/phosphatase family protein [Aliiroseovarius sp. Z3]